LSIPWYLVALGLLIALGLGSLVWRGRGRGGRRRELSFYADLVALVVTSFVVGILALTTLTSPPQPTPTPRQLSARAANPSVVPTGRPTLPPPPTPTATATDTPTPEPPATVTYTVQPGDTLSYIAQVYNVSVDAIVRTNNLPSAHELRVGQVLVIPVHGREATPPAAREGKIVHIVQSGEVLSEIARRYGVGMQAIIKANDLPSANALRVGQELIIPVATATPARETATGTVAPSSTPTPEGSASPGEVSPQATGAPSVTTTPTQSPTGTARPAAPAPTVTAAASLVHIVQPGDTLLGIARQYGVSVDALEAANPGIDPRALRVGQKVVIPAGAATPPPTATAPLQPSATPRSSALYPAPRLVSPEDGASFGGIHQEIILRWAWDGQLGPDEWFDVQIAEKEGDFLGRVWTKETQWRLPKDFFDGRWRWRIVVIRGVQGQSREEISRPSEIRHIDWH